MPLKRTLPYAQYRNRTNGSQGVSLFHKVFFPDIFKIKKANLMPPLNSLNVYFYKNKTGNAGVLIIVIYIWIHALVSGFNLIQFPAQCEIACFHKIRKTAVSGTFTPETTANMRFENLY